MNKIIKTKCIICGKEFKKRTGTAKGKRGYGIKRQTAKTCSSKCSKEYCVIRQRVVSKEYQRSKK